ncbi:MAG: hypothetical protein QOJ07_1405, partial [Thermoleophilaceae bacterium]|nr:hypothetical protein [Thermoleophilaceae bacterium]
MDGITFEDDRVVARPGSGERGRQPGDAACGDDELHPPELSGRDGTGQAARVRKVRASRAAAGPTAPAAS